MKYPYILSCESTVDLPYSYISGRDISVLFYTYSVDGEVYTDDMQRDPNARAEFFAKIKEGKLPSTSQINYNRYYQYFEQLLQEGDVLHIAFGSGMTPSVNNAYDAAAALSKKYPERKIYVVDSLCSCVGYGLLTESVADLRDSGASLEDALNWTLENRGKVRHQIYCTDLTQFRRSGRVSGPVAIVGNLLGICPIMHLNSEGKIIAYKKVKGKKNAMTLTVDTVVSEIEGGNSYKGTLYVSNADCDDAAEEIRAMLKERLPDVKIKDAKIGMVISAHCGPNTVAIFYYGPERTL